MQTFCSYHPTKPASWDCDTCDQYLCDDCVVVRKDKQFGLEKEFRLCPKCNQAVEWIGVANILKPFWTRLPGFFVYPFYLQPLILNLILCAAMFFFSGPSLVNVLVRVAIWGIWLKYSFASLKETATGNLNPPGITLDTISSDFQEVFKQLVIYIALGFVIALAAGVLGNVFGIIFGIIALLLLPAMIILLVSTGSLIQALNPVAFISLPIRIGSGYLLMYFFLVLLGGAPAAIFNMSKAVLPMAVLPFLIAFFQNYYTLISYNLMGYVLLQYHEEIGYDVDYEDFQAQGTTQKKTERPSSPFLNEVEVHIKDGDYELALSMLKNEINERHTEDLEVYNRYFHLLKLQNMSADLIAHGKVYIDKLIEADEREEACMAYLECSKRDNHFAPSAKGLVRLGGWLKKSGQCKEAIRAYAAFNKVYSKDPMVPIVCFRAAEILNETFGQKAKAQGLLRAIVHKYPDHHIVPFVETYSKKIRV